MAPITSSWAIEIKIFPPSNALLFILIYACDVKEARKGIPCCSIFDLIERQAGIKRRQSCKWRKNLSKPYGEWKICTNLSVDGWRGWRRINMKSSGESHAEERKDERMNLLQPNLFTWIIFYLRRSLWVKWLLEIFIKSFLIIKLCIWAHPKMQVLYYFKPKNLFIYKTEFSSQKLFKISNSLTWA